MKTRSYRARSSVYPWLAACVPSALACVTSPFDGQNIASPTTSITVAGYTIEPGEPVTIEAFNSLTAGWDVIGTTTSALTPTLDAGLWTNSPDLYFYTTPVQVADASRWETLARWGRDGRTATLRAHTPQWDLFRGDVGSVACVQSIPPGVDFWNGAGQCGFRQGSLRVKTSLPPVVAHERELGGFASGVTTRELARNGESLLLSTFFLHFQHADHPAAHDRRSSARRRR